jgi:hypothetical protein
VDGEDSVSVFLYFPGINKVTIANAKVFTSKRNFLMDKGYWASIKIRI